MEVLVKILLLLHVMVPRVGEVLLDLLAATFIAGVG